MKARVPQSSRGTEATRSKNWGWRTSGGRSFPFRGRPPLFLAFGVIGVVWSGVFSTGGLSDGVVFEGLISVTSAMRLGLYCALLWIENGVFGVCVATGKLIEKVRLEAV